MFKIIILDIKIINQNINQENQKLIKKNIKINWQLA